MAKVKWQTRSLWGLVLAGVLLLGSGVISSWLSSSGQLNQALANQALANQALAKQTPAKQDLGNIDTYEAVLDRVFDQRLAASSQSTAEPIQPIPLTLPLDPQKVALGDRLFHDPQLSGDRSMSCATCHSNSLGGADGLSVSIGTRRNSHQRNDLLETLNTPTVWNSAFNFRQMWDGSVASLEEQVDRPLLSPSEMKSSWAEVIARLGKDDAYRKAFQALYPEGIQPDTVRQAIATYERALMTPNARFDRFLKGEPSAITAEEKKGYDLFKGYGCVACHQGVNVGGNLFQRLGVMEDYFMARGNVQKVDLGQMNITGRVRDLYVFKVPSLRNIELTAPYLHDGSVETLPEIVHIMGKYQLGREIPKDDAAAIVSFLRTLTGSLPDDVLANTAKGEGI